MITQETIDEVTRRLVATYDPLTIYLFGSYAWGFPTEDSDLDFAIIVQETGLRRVERMRLGLKALHGLGVSKDIIVYTKAEFDKAVVHPSSMARKICRRGKMLYGSYSPPAEFESQYGQKHEAAYKPWLKNAQNALHVVQIALEHNDDQVFDVTIFHAQQAVENTLKAFLVFNRIPVLKTHDLEKLLWLCEEIDGKLASLAPHTARVAPYADEDGFSVNNFEHETTREELAQARDAAKAVLDFVEKQIAEEVENENSRCNS